MTFRTIAYWAALVLSILFVLGAVVLVAATYIDVKAHAEAVGPQLIPVLTLLLTAMSTFAAVFFGWRLDRRQAMELEIKTREMELKLREMEHRLNKQMQREPLNSTEQV